MINLCGGEGRVSLLTDSSTTATCLHNVMIRHDVHYLQSNDDACRYGAVVVAAAAAAAVPTSLPPPSISRPATSSR